MVEERSLENPAFARGAMRGLVTVVGVGVAIFCLSYFVTSDWTPWPRMAAHFAGVIAVFLIVDLVFAKLWGLPTRFRLKRR